jgi:tRNA(His) guanylyltransferase
MACSRFEYVKAYEEHDVLLRNAWAVVRLDGRGFTRFTAAAGYAKPNDARGLAAMADAARAVCAAFPDLVVAYGQSDEFSFLLRRGSALFGRRREKILSTVVSLFSAAFVGAWGEHFGGAPLPAVPAFDGRVVVYPGVREVRDYFSWRQADCHVNNLFNTCFWALVGGGAGRAEAEAALRGTTAAEKNEMLFQRFGVNYNDQPAVFRKGTVLVRLEKRRKQGANDAGGVGAAAAAGDSGAATAADGILMRHDDIIRDAFWRTHSHLLRDHPPDAPPPGA